MRSWIVIAVFAVTLHGQEKAKPQPGEVHLAIRCLKRAPKGVPGIKKGRRCVVVPGKASVVRYGEMKELPEQWERVHPDDKPLPAKPGQKPLLFRPVLGDPVLVGLEVKTEIMQFELGTCVVGTATFREVLGSTKVKLDMEGTVVEMPRIVESVAKFQLILPSVPSVTCTLARPGAKPIVLEIKVAEKAE